MALGLAMGMHWDSCAVTSPPIVDPIQIPMLLWYDFTDTGGMFQEVDSFTTAADADNDKIGRIKNKAITAQTNLGIADTSRIGVFGRASTNGRRPTFKTGGANGYNYAQFTASAVTGIITKQDSDYGVHSGTTLRSGGIGGHNWSYLMVSQADDNDSDGDAERMFGLNFAQLGTTTSRQLTVLREDTDQVRLKTTSTAGAAVATRSLPASASDGLTKNTSLEVRISSAQPEVGAQGAPLWRHARGLNNSLDVAVDQIFVDEVLAGSAITSSLQESGFVGGVAVGGDSINLPNTLHFDGKIYEFILFNQSLSFSDMNGLAYYYAQKYGIDIEGEN